MIHQHIFASPKPSLTEAQFQDYWLNVHAVNFASKIKQIKKYKIDTRIAFSLDPKPIWNGVAEIWLRNEEEQLASMQSPEFIDGARRDEPNWAAFWNTLGLDCETATVADGFAGAEPPADGVKLLVLYRRAMGLTVAEYRTRHREALAVEAAKLPAVQRCDLAFTRDGLYAVGEARFDGVGHYWFESVAAAEATLSGADRHLLLPDDTALIDPQQIFFMLTREHWVIGPDARD